MTSPALRISGLTMAFGFRTVLDGMDLDVERGQVFGYIGPNGAGKTTTVRILTGLADGFEGQVEVVGHDVRTDPLAVKRRVGYVPENAALYEALRVSEFLTLVGRLHGLPEDVIERRGTRLLVGFGLEARVRSPLSALSKGMRQKVLIASALLHDPEVLFLDEPLTGLDVASAMLVKELVAGLAQRGRTVFYCSHMMDIVERVCDRIAILAEGKIVADGTFEQLSEMRSGGSLEAIFSELTGTGQERYAAEQILDALDGGDAVA